MERSLLYWYSEENHVLSFKTVLLLRFSFAIFEKQELQKDFNCLRYALQKNE